MTIEQKQCLLKYLGYYKGTVDGDWGNLSREATRQFKKAFGLAQNDICDTDTEKALKHSVTYGIQKNTDSKEPAKSGDFWDGIKHFKRLEFKCKCGNIYCNGFPVEPEEKLVTVADRVREHFGRTATVSSGLRCPRHNANVGGVSNSRHLTGKAMDFCISGKTAAQVLAYVNKQPEIRYAYAIDNTFVHMDIQ